MPGRKLMLVVFLLICCISSGCVLVKLKKEMGEVTAGTILVGRISSQVPVNGPIIVSAFSQVQGKRKIEHYTILHDTGEFELFVEKGGYYVFAFNDKNENLIYDSDEPAGQYGTPELVDAPAGGVVSRIDISLHPAGGNLVWQAGQPISEDLPPVLYSRLAGVITDLDDERFQPVHGTRGFWEPVSFYKEFGGTIYFLEEYDPSKIPILFIHGAGGSPKDWQYFVENIDRSRFQAWFYYYPSGARIRSMANLLYWKLENLRVKYKFDTLFITAHSMGGLVGRSFIKDFSLGFPFVKLFVSLATPWGGDKMAEYGVKQSPVLIPCWLDMQPQGDFISSLFREKMPDTLDYYLFYGYRGSRNPWGSNNDGTINLSSLLDKRAQSEAKMSYAFNEDHGSILQSREVLAQYNMVLHAYLSRHDVLRDHSGGYLRANFTFNKVDAGPSPLPQLILRALDKEDADLVVALNSEDAGRKLGPFRPGKYLANISAEAFVTQKSWVPITIETERIPELNFTLAPEGVLSGYVTTPLDPENNMAGMPAWEKQPWDNNIQLQSIALVGKGVERTLYPLLGDNFDYYQMEVSHTDYCYNGFFRFFGLPEGRYTLIMLGRDGKKIVEKRYVMPGKAESLKIYEWNSDG